ncbi:hypothetical protein L917_10409 [Phytophthora nicotianae]|uniref:Uncharacterized protein n=1 Tax=Phytophthora nicotianae TaxID=4792 RepID=W2L2Z9_PHYNI|nr:hypothetical protein L917_10409 [Phytophthora nicotianae]
MDNDGPAVNLEVLATLFSAERVVHLSIDPPVDTGKHSLNSAHRCRQAKLALELPCRVAALGCCAQQQANIFALSEQQQVEAFAALSRFQKVRG